MDEDDRYNLEADFLHDKEIEAFEAWFDQGWVSFKEFLLQESDAIQYNEDFQAFYNEVRMEEYEHVPSFIYIWIDELEELLKDSEWQNYKEWAYTHWQDNYR